MTRSTSQRPLREGRIALAVRWLLGLLSLIGPLMSKAPSISYTIIGLILNILLFQIIATILIWFVKLLVYSVQRILQSTAREEPTHIFPATESIISPQIVETFKRMPQAEQAKSLQPPAEHPKQQHPTLPLSWEHYGLLFYCLESLTLEQGGILRTPEMTSQLKEIHHSLWMNLLSEDENVARAAQADSAGYHLFRSDFGMNRKEAQQRADVYKTAAKTLLELAQEVEECRKADDWERVLQTTRRAEMSMNSLAEFWEQMSSQIAAEWLESNDPTASPKQKP